MMCRSGIMSHLLPASILKVRPSLSFLILCFVVLSLVSGDDGTDGDGGEVTEAAVTEANVTELPQRHCFHCNTYDVLKDEECRAPPIPLKYSRNCDAVLGIIPQADNGDPKIIICGTVYSLEGDGIMHRFCTVKGGVLPRTQTDDGVGIIATPGTCVEGKGRPQNYLPYHGIKACFCDTEDNCNNITTPDQAFLHQPTCQLVFLLIVVLLILL